MKTLRDKKEKSKLSIFGFFLTILVCWLIIQLPEFIQGAMVGIIVGYWLYIYLHSASSKQITCISEKNIHIFDDNSEVCKCWGMMKDGTKFSIPVRGQP